MAEKDPWVFQDLAERHANLVFHVALSWTRDPVEAQDLAQTSFLKAWKAFESFEPGSNFKAWILAILRHTLIDHIRWKARLPRALSIAELEPSQEPKASAPPPMVIDLDSREVFYDLFGDEIAGIMKALPEEYQLAVLLHDVEDMGYQEIAGALGVPVGTIRSRIHRGRALLSQRLKDYAAGIGYLRQNRS